MVYVVCVIINTDGLGLHKKTQEVMVRKRYRKASRSGFVPGDLIIATVGVIGGSLNRNGTKTIINVAGSPLLVICVASTIDKVHRNVCVVANNSLVWILIDQERYFTKLT